MLSGEVINKKYRLEKSIGKGSFGNVYKASHNGSSYAVKIVFSQNITADITRESKLATLLKHTNIIKCYEADKCIIKGAEYLYFLMELGEYSLRKRLDERILDMEGEILKLACDLANGLAYLHGQNYIHRDIKPANILWCNNNWKISDFDTLRLMEQTHAAKTSFAGTYAYVPPEGFRGEISAAFDIWSYGVMLMEARTSVRPFDTPVRELDWYGVINNNKPNISPLLLPPLREIVEGCLKKEASRRLNINDILKHLGISPRTAIVTEEKQTKSLGINESVIIAKPIPSQLIIESGITKIAKYSYKDRTDIKSVIIPDSVTEIGDWAFLDCTSLAAIAIPDSVTKIGNWIFSGCTSLKSITIPYSVTKIGNWIFSGCTSLKSITIPKSVTELGEGAFDGCLRFTSIAIPDSVTKIGNGAFKDCKSLSSITIPRSVIEIGNEAFGGCESLASITIPDSVKKIGNGAFRDCKSLSSITIPRSVTEIGERAFDRRKSLIISGYIASSAEKYAKDYRIKFKALDSSIDKSIADQLIIKPGTTKIEDYSYKDRIDIKSVIIPDSVTEIGDWAFRDCTSLSSITIPNSVTRIGNWVFSGCTSLASITIPDSVTAIGEVSFIGCESLVISGYTASYAEKYANDNHIKFKALNSIIDKSIADQLIIKPGTTKIEDYSYKDRTDIKSVIIPKSVIEIGDGAFSDCVSLLSITIPKNVTAIGQGTFRGCTSLLSISIPNSVTNIGQRAFRGCTSLKSITIPRSVTKIGLEAFQNCKSLVISGYKYSYAEKHAKENNIKFIKL